MKLSHIFCALIIDQIVFLYMEELVFDDHLSNLCVFDRIATETILTF